MRRREIDPTQGSLGAYCVRQGRCRNGGLALQNAKAFFSGYLGGEGHELFAHEPRVVPDDQRLTRIFAMTSLQITAYRFGGTPDVLECELIGNDGSPARGSKAYGHGWKSKS